MIALVLAALAADVRLQITAVGGVVTQQERAFLELPVQHTARFVEHALGVTLPASLPIDVTLYRDRAAFDAVKRERGFPTWALGWFEPSRDGARAAVLDTGDRDQARRTFLHESTHHLLGFSHPAPRWLNEGLAQVFEGASVRGNLLTVTSREGYLDALVASGRPSVHAIVTNQARWSEQPTQAAGRLYASAWGLCALLISSPEGQRTLAAVLAAHRRDPRPDAVLAAIEHAWPGGLASLERAFDQWASRPPRTLALTVPVPTATSGADALWRTCDDGRMVRRGTGCN